MSEPFDEDDVADMMSGIFGQPAKPKNPFMAYLPPDTRRWLSRITREAKAKEGTHE